MAGHQTPLSGIPHCPTTVPNRLDVWQWQVIRHRYQASRIVLRLCLMVDRSLYYRLIASIGQTGLRIRNSKAVTTGLLSFRLSASVNQLNSQPVLAPRISYLEHKTNDWVQSKISFFVGPREPLLATVKRRKLALFGHIIRHDSLSKTILQGTLEGGRRRDRLRKCWVDSIKERTSLPMPELLTKAFCRSDWRKISAGSSLISPR